MIGTNFDRVRQFFLDPSTEGKDLRVAVKVACIAVKIIGAFSMFSSAISPFFGQNIFYAVVHLVLTREVFIVAENLENMLDLFNRTVNSFVPDVFVNALLKKTWVLGPLFGGLFIDFLHSRPTSPKT